MSTLADAYVRLRPDTSRLGPDMVKGTEKPAGDAGQRAGSSFGKRMVTAISAAVAVGAAVVGAKLVAGIKESVDAARDLNETQSKVGVIFGKSAKDVERFAATAATRMGQSKQTVLDGAATFAIYGKAAGKSGGDLVKFSTKLTALASDVGSFSNEDPAQVIADFGAAMRGEFDPVEKYGILLNETTVKNRALKMGLIETTKDALTPQQRVLAVQAELFRQTRDAQGDFTRTSAGLANQQRILQAQWENFKATIGQALLPVVNQFVTMLNTRLMPALNELWAKHGPQVTAWLGEATTKLSGLVERAAAMDWGTAWADAREQIGGLAEKLGSVDWATLWGAITDAFRTIREDGPSFNETLTVANTIITFLADHADDLAKALPYLAAGWIAVKVAQIGANVAQALSPVLTIASALANRRLAASNLELAAAMSAQTGALTASTASTTANTVATNVGSTSRVRAVASWVGMRVAQLAAVPGIIAATVAQWAQNAAWLAFPLTWVIAAIVAVIAIIVLLWTKNEGFRKVVLAVWAGIKIAIKAVGDWFVNTLWPSLKRAYDQLISVGRFLLNTYISIWKGIFNAIFTAYGWIRDRVFTPLKNFITTTIPNAFKTGVEGIKTWWEKLKEYAAKPVRFVIDTVVNRGIIGTFNKVSGFFGGPQVAPVAGIGDGPGAPGAAARHDGTGDGLGDMFGFLRGPANWIKNRVSGGIDAITTKFGDNTLTKNVTGMGRKLLGGLVNKAKSLLTSSEFAGGGEGTGGLQAGISTVLGSLRGTFGSVPVISGLRPGATTLSGNRSYHASGRAIDIRPYYPWAAFLRAVWGSRMRELITPWNNLNILNGRPHRYTGAVWNQHNFPGGNAHIHAAMDEGGFLVPGWNAPIFNGTGRLEPVTPPATMDEVVDLLEQLLGVMTRLAPDIGREINGVGSSLRRIARTH